MRKHLAPFFFCQEFITSVDIYLPRTEISADTCDTLHRASHNDGCLPERNAATIHTCSLPSNMGYFFLSPCPHLLVKNRLLRKSWVYLGVGQTVLESGEKVSHHPLI